jgi:hypothetical protein
MVTPMAAPKATLKTAERLVMNIPRCTELYRSLGTIILGELNAANKKGGNQVPPFLELTL